MKDFYVLSAGIIRKTEHGGHVFYIAENVQSKNHKDAIDKAWEQAKQDAMFNEHGILWDHVETVSVEDSDGSLHTMKVIKSFMRFAQELGSHSLAADVYSNIKDLSTVLRAAFDEEGLTDGDETIH